MKRLFALLMCIMLFVAATPSFAAETTESTERVTEPLLGDVVTDGVLTNEDALELREYLAGYVSTVKDFDASKLSLADVNQDGKISSADLNELIKLIPTMNLSFVTEDRLSFSKQTI